MVLMVEMIEFSIAGWISAAVVASLTGISGFSAVCQLVS